MSRKFRVLRLEHGLVRVIGLYIEVGSKARVLANVRLHFTCEIRILLMRGDRQHKAIERLVLPDRCREVGYLHGCAGDLKIIYQEGRTCSELLLPCEFGFLQGRLIEIEIGPATEPRFEQDHRNPCMPRKGRLLLQAALEEVERGLVLVGFHRGLGAKAEDHAVVRIGFKRRSESFESCSRFALSHQLHTRFQQLGTLDGHRSGGRRRPVTGPGRSRWHVLRPGGTDERAKPKSKTERQKTRVRTIPEAHRESIASPWLRRVCPTRPQATLEGRSFCMRILTRYILREVLSHALLGGVLFTFVLFTSRLGKILEIIVRDSASVSDVARLVAYFLPEALVVTIPMAVLVGILLGLSRLAADSEITAMRAAGMGALDFVRVISLVSLGALLLGLFNSLYLAPHSAAALLRLEGRLKYAQASFEVQPRVFDEDFKNIVLYVQDVRPGTGAALWRHVFLADLTQPASPRITTANEALVTQEQTGDGSGGLHLLLRDGSQHEISSADANQYNIETFASADLPMQSGAQDDTHISRSDTPILALSLAELRVRASQSAGPGGEKRSRPYRIELNKRFSYPFACLVLMLVGVPLGLASKRGGKSTGFVVTILLVVTYYVISLIGTALATQGKLPPFIGVWAANILFTLAGSILLQQLSAGGLILSAISGMGTNLAGSLRRLASDHDPEAIVKAAQPSLPKRIANSVRGALHIRFPLILDEYIMKTFAQNFAIVLLVFNMLFLIFTFFELIGDIIRNRTPLVTVGDYLLNLIPFVLYNVTPLCVLVAVLITFGALARSSELTAMKAAGVSLYRIVTPVLVLAAVVAVALFAFDEFYLPAANRRQEALRSIIKGKPAQTFLRPDRKWISGQTAAPPVETEALFNGSGTLPQTHPAEPIHIFYYQFFDPDRNVFANLTVFEFDPVTFALTKRIFAQSARWDARVDRWLFEDGWVRTFEGASIASYDPFTLTTFVAIQERPQYFKKEDRQSQEMSFGELTRYIGDLRQSGFDTKRLSVQLNRKLAYPAVTLVMAMLAMPFAFSTGKRGGVTGFAAAILLAVVYLGTSSFFEAMGNFNQLPPGLAAWSPDVLFALAGGWLLLRTPT